MRGFAGSTARGLPRSPGAASFPGRRLGRGSGPVPNAGTRLLRTPKPRLRLPPTGKGPSSQVRCGASRLPVRPLHPLHTLHPAAARSQHPSPCAATSACRAQGPSPGASTGSGANFALPDVHPVVPEKGGISPQGARVCWGAGHVPGGAAPPGEARAVTPPGTGKSAAAPVPAAARGSDPVRGTTLHWRCWFAPRRLQLNALAKQPGLSPRDLVLGKPAPAWR